MVAGGLPVARRAVGSGDKKRIGLHCTIGGSHRSKEDRR